MRLISLRAGIKALILATGATALLLASNASYAASANEILGLADMSRAATQRIAVQQAVLALASEASDIDGDGFPEAPAMLTGSGGPVRGGYIPTSSAAPKTDSYTVKLGYCAWDNGSTNSSTDRIAGNVSAANAPVLAVISAGIDNIFDTTCTSLAAGGGASGDDYVITYTTTQIQQGNSGTQYFGDPVASLAVLQGLNPAVLKDGQIRLTKDSNSLYRWNAGTSVWTPVGGSGTSAPWKTDDNSKYFTYNAISIGTNQSLAKFQVHGGDLGTAAGNIVVIASQSHAANNVMMLNTLGYRFANGTDWTTSSTRIQSKIDNTDMAFIEFNPSGAQGGIAFGAGMSANNPGGVAEVMRLTQEGRVGVRVTVPYAGLAVNTTGQIGSANQTPYDIGAGTIGAGKSIYSYGTICVGNSNHDCSGINGTVLGYNTLTFAPGSATPTTLSQGSWGTLKINTAYGFTEVGAQNAGFSHFVTDRPAFYFNRELRAEGVVGVYNSGTYLTASTGNIAGYRIWTEQPRSRQTIAASIYGAGFETAPIEIREYNYEPYNNSDIANRAPKLAFHWAGVAAAMIRLSNDGYIEVMNQVASDWGGFRAGWMQAYQYNALSDRRLKRDITPISDALETINNLSGYHYFFNNEAYPDRNMPKGRQVGFIAQEVEKYVPELVSTGADGFKSVNYSQMTALLLQGIKEQQNVLQHFIKKDKSTISVSIQTIEGNEAHFKRLDAEKLTVIQLEAESAQIKKLKAEQIDTDRISLVKSGEAEVFVSAGSFQPIFNPPQGAQYMLNAFAEDGSIAIASVTVLGSKVVITPISSTGIEVKAWGSQVGLVAENKTIKTTWIRTH